MDSLRNRKVEKQRAHTMFNVWISLRGFGADVLYNIVYYMTFKSVQSRGNKPESGTLMLSYPLVTIFDYCFYDYFYFYDYFRARRTHLSSKRAEKLYFRTTA